MPEGAHHKKGIGAPEGWHVGFVCSGMRLTCFFVPFPSGGRIGLKIKGMVYAKREGGF